MKDHDCVDEIVEEITEVLKDVLGFWSKGGWNCQKDGLNEKLLNVMHQLQVIREEMI
jgi:hypothetical protein